MAISKDSCGLHYSQSSSWFEIRLFYIRIAPYVFSDVPDHLTLLHHRRDVTVGSLPATAFLRRDRVDKDTSEVTYVSTDSVRVTGGVECEVFERGEMVLCGNLVRLDTVENGSDSMMGWSMDCYLSGSISSGDSALFRPKMEVSSPLFEVYVAGCCSGVPVILTRTIQVSPRRRHSKHALLDAIPEDDEIEKEYSGVNGLVRHRKMQIEAEDDYESDRKVEHNYYSEDMYYGEDGQLSWFNAGVRVGVGIGLGMCLGVGIGVSLLMRSYQTTTRNFKKSFF